MDCFFSRFAQFGDRRHLLGIRPGEYDSGRVGGGCVPIKTEEGWLILYHGATEENRYVMGAALLDLNDPTIVLKERKHLF